MGETAKLSRVVGLKEATKAVKNGRAAKVYVARDSEVPTAELLALCREKGVEADASRNLSELGEMAGISVRAAAVAILKT